MSKKEQKALPIDEHEEDYFRARRVKVMHSNFMAQIVVPSRKEK